MKMPVRVYSVSILVAFFFVFGGCGTGELEGEGGGEEDSGGEEARGGVEQNCFADGTCLDGLRCIDERCVVPGLEDYGGEAEPCYPNDTCNEGFICVDGTCVSPQGEEPCVPDCTGRECGVDPVCGEQCAPGCDDGQGCSSEGQCVEASCVPDCSGLSCGVDPVCGEPCPPGCDDGFYCDGSGQCIEEICVPDCSGRVCGPDPVCGEECLPGCGVSASCDTGGQCIADDCVHGCGETVQVAIVFLSASFEFTTPVDVILNGVRHEFHGLTVDDPIWDISVTQDASIMPARGKVLTLNQHLVSVEFDLDQVQFDGYSRGGFGNFNYKILKRHADMNLNQLNNEPASREYWAGVVDETGILQVYDDPAHPSPTFPTFVLGETNMEIGMNTSVSNWNSSGKIVITIGEVGNQ